MAANSTRKKIRDEARKMVYDIENAMMRLKRIEELGEDHSPVINSYVPAIVGVLDQAHQFVDSFREKL